MVFLVGSCGEAFEVEVLGFEGMGWGVGFDLGDEVGDFIVVHFAFSTAFSHRYA